MFQFAEESQQQSVYQGLLRVSITKDTPQAVRDAFELVRLYSEVQRLQQENNRLNGVLGDIGRVATLHTTA